MRLLNISKELITGFLQTIGKEWWVEVTTAEPCCTYYFGPFARSKDAKTAQPGYIEDLQGEGARGIQTEIRQCQPKVLTICEEADC